MQLNESTDLMARWRATGGAFDARPRVADDGDDGLAAGAPTDSSFGASCRIDDGLTAASQTVGSNPLCMADEGLAAMTPTRVCP